MGTQQILLIVLSVIIVGVAIAVGISMFNNQAYNSNKTAIASDVQSYAAQVVQYWKTPISQGGYAGTTTDLVIADVEAYIGFTEAAVDGGSQVGIKTENGYYYISAVTGGAATGGDATVKITGVGNAEKGGQNPHIVITITLPAGTITAEATDE